MNLYSSLVSIQNENISSYRLQFSLQIFYSDTLEFHECDSLLGSISVTSKEKFEIKLNLQNSPKFLRIDPGVFYSVQSNPTCDIIRISQQKEVEEVSLNFNTPLLKSNDLHLEIIDDNQTLMVCGSDPWYVFENPFIGSDICIKFTSQIITGFSE
jgi:hypothetical protein